MRKFYKFVKNGKKMLIVVCREDRSGGLAGLQNQ